MSQRHHANEETDFEGGSLLPHTPMHIHFGKEDAMDESKTSVYFLFRHFYITIIIICVSVRF